MEIFYCTCTKAGAGGGSHSRSTGRRTDGDRDIVVESEPMSNVPTVPYFFFDFSFCSV